MNIFIAVTSYESKIYTRCANALIDNIREIEKAGHQVRTYFHSGDCYIARARNYCARIFLETDCTDLVFIDCDLGFDKDAILKLFKTDKQVVAGIYPLRSDDPDIIKNNRWPCTLKFDDVTNNCLDENTGLVSALRVPAGFLRINRSVFNLLILSGTVKLDSSDLYNFFDQGTIFPDEPGTWYGEDTAFCKRWRSVGGELWIVPNIDFTHTGTKDFSGNLHEALLTGSPVDDLIKRINAAVAVNERQV